MVATRISAIDVAKCHVQLLSFGVVKKAEIGILWAVSICNSSFDFPREMEMVMSTPSPGERRHSSVDVVIRPQGA